MEKLHDLLSSIYSHHDGILCATVCGVDLVEGFNREQFENFLLDASDAVHRYILESEEPHGIVWYKNGVWANIKNGIEYHGETQKPVSYWSVNRIPKIPDRLKNT